MAKLSKLKPRLATLNTTRAQTPSQQRVRGTTNQRNRMRVLRRDKGLCQQCLNECRTRIATEVDHIVPLHRGGSDDDSNKQSLCDECHAVKSAEEEKWRRG